MTPNKHNLFVIRQATPQDTRRISYLIQKNTDKVTENNYTMAQKNAWKKANTPKAIQNQLAHRILFCAVKNGQLYGTIGLMGNEMVGLYVSYSKRGRGIGKLLLAHLEDYAREQGISRLKLTATPSAKPLYEKSGYTPHNQVTVQINGVTFLETSMSKML